MKYNYYILLGIALTALPISMQAQNQQKKDSTMNRTVVVEQVYNPDILDASKVNVLPKVEEPTIGKNAVEYATNLFPAISIPGSLMNPYTVLEKQPDSKPGYARLGYGMYGNLDLFANYLFRLTDRDKLNIRFQMDGMDGKLTMPSGDEKWNAFYYRTRANIDFTHQFNKVDLNVAGNFGLSNFNFAPKEFGKQKFTSGDVHLGVVTTDETLPFRLSAETNLMLYDRRKNNPFFTENGTSETQVRTKGLISGNISEEQSINILLDMRNIFYSKDTGSQDTIYENRTTLGLNPYYALNSDSWHLRLGANVDFSFGGGKTLRVSPDITAEYIFSDSYVLYAKATGGKIVNDFRQLEIFAPYALSTNPIYDTYEQLNAALGFKASPYPGLWFNLYGGYQNLKDDLFQVRQEIDYSATPDAGSLPYKYLSLSYTNDHNVNLGIEASYEYKDIFSIFAKGKYYHWTAKEEATIFSNPLFLRPQAEICFGTEVHPIAPLRLNLGYQYTHWSVSEQPSVSNLHIGANYNVYKGISVYARINNILNKKYQYYLGYPTEGFNFLGGLSVQF